MSALEAIVRGNRVLTTKDLHGTWCIRQSAVPFPGTGGDAALWCAVIVWDLADVFSLRTPEPLKQCFVRDLERH